MPENNPAENNSPSWRELSEFIAKQSEKERGVIDFWFKMAAGVLALVVFVVGTALAFIGFKTVEDAKTVAARTAHDSAQERINEILKQPAIQKLVEDTARELLATGAFRKVTEDVVTAQLSVAVRAEIAKRGPEIVGTELARRNLLPRTITEGRANEFRPKLQRFAGKTVGIRSDRTSEAIGFAKELAKTLRDSGLKAKLFAEDATTPTHVAVYEEQYRELGNTVSDLIKQATGINAPVEVRPYDNGQDDDSKVFVIVGPR